MSGNQARALAGCAFFFEAALAGCSSAPYRQGSPSSTDLATITTDVESSRGNSDDGRTLFFTNVDGQALSNQWISRTPTEVRLAPGKHVVWLQYTHKTLRVAPRIVLDVAAGERYQIHEANKGGAPRFWLTRLGDSQPLPIDFLGR